MPVLGSCVAFQSITAIEYMSALGQKRTFTEVCAMSALPPKADIGTQPCDVRFVPKADILRSTGARRRSGRIQCDTGKLLDERESRPPSGGGLTHFEVKTVPESRAPSEPFSIVLLKRTSAAVAMASFICASVAPAAFAALVV